MPRDSKNEIRLRIHKRIRSRVSGTESRPRLAVFRSVKHIYAQVIDDGKGHTLAAAGSNEKDVRGKGGNVDQLLPKLLERAPISMDRFLAEFAGEFHNQAAGA